MTTDYRVRNADKLKRWANIPDELKAYRQWALADVKKGSKLPLYVNYRGDVVAAEVDNSSTFMSFDAATQFADVFDMEVGFILTRNDPYCIVDLDIKPETPEPVAKNLHDFAATAESYVERSTGGLGLHVVVRARLLHGRRHKNIEIYDDRRFIIFTGNCLTQNVITDGQWFAESVLKLIGDELSIDGVSYVNGEQTQEDSEVLQRACSAANGERFYNLYMRADFTGFDRKANGEPDYSQADAYLVQHLCFYSADNFQVERMWLASAIGTRPKVMQREDYRKTTINNIRLRLVAEQEANRRAAEDGKRVADQLLRDYDEKRAQASTTPYQNRLPDPPGILNDLVQYILGSAAIPNRGAAIATALAFLTAYCARTVNISGTGCNLYILLIGETSTGKEILHDGIDRLVDLLHNSGIVTADSFFGRYDATKQGLQRAFQTSPSVMHLITEGGHFIEQLANAENGRNQVAAELRKLITSQFMRSAAHNISGGTMRSKAEDSLGKKLGIAYSIATDTTPQRLFNAFTSVMIEDGLLTRFLIIEGDNDYQLLNKNRKLVPPEHLFDHLKNLAARATKISMDIDMRGDGGVARPVYESPQVAQLLDDFELECAENKRRYRNHAEKKYPWLRAHLFVLRLCGVLAFSDNPNTNEPVITRAHVEWAIAVVRASIASVHGNADSGMVGSGDDACLRATIKIIHTYYKDELSPVYAKKNSLVGLRANGIIFEQYISARTASIPAFKNHRLGATAATKMILGTLVSNGQLVKIDSAYVLNRFGINYRGVMYIPTEEFDV